MLWFSRLSDEVNASLELECLFQGVCVVERAKAYGNEASSVSKGYRPLDNEASQLLEI